MSAFVTTLLSFPPNRGMVISPSSQLRTVWRGLPLAAVITAD